jgi:O-acetyl-ADP-ribose deacetylase (regulator of RNase III)
MKINDTEVRVVSGSVAKQDVDVIVNAANTGMRGGGGIDGVIHSLAGPKMLAELKAVAPHGAKTSEVVVTGAHNLPQKYIFHVAGPVWHGGATGEADLLAACYRNATVKANELGVSSIAFCSISTGVYGYPVDAAAKIAVETVCNTLSTFPRTSLRTVVFAMYGANEERVFAHVLAEYSR